jgi:(p)ppGpp synthase/HD superfamily hydrolase
MVSDATGAGVIVPAQTNGGLYGQMHDAGASSDDIRAVQTAYAAALPLFFGLYRGSGRPFICHLVGTASALAQIGAGRDMIVAGLFHALFESALFPDGRTAAVKTNRDAVAKLLGRDVFDLVQSFETWPWNDDAIAMLAMAAAPADAATARLWRLRLANEIDDMSHCNFVLAQKPNRDIRSRLAGCAAMARTLGEERMATTFEALAVDYARQQIWAQDLNRNPSSNSYRLLPGVKSYLRTRHAPAHRLKVI